MMATRNPKVAPKKKSTGSKPKNNPESKEQAWTDTDDTETTKESESKQTKGSSDSSEPAQKGSLISVREAPDALQSDVITNPMTTDTELPYATETDSMASLDSAGIKRKIKRNTVVPTDGEETSGRLTPDSELKKDAWSGEADISESDVAVSRPSSAAAMYREALMNPKSRPATAPSKQPLTTVSQRPKTAPSHSIKKSTIPSTSDIESVMQQNDTSNKTSTKNGEITAAWTDNTLALQSEITKDAVSTVSSCDLLAPPRVSGEQNAYIPIFYAKDCIQKVMDDMKRMKANHIKVVDQIQDQYKSIEDEIQGKFNTFVIGLRTQYAEKVHTFRHVIEIHREDTGRKQEYWQNTVKSMQGKNKKLLEEKRQLMVKNREEFTRLEEEKIKAVKELTGLLDEKHAKFTSMLNDLKNERIKSLELEERLKELQLQNQKLQEDCDSNKGTYEQELLAIQMKHNEQLQEQKQQLDLLQREKDESIEKEKNQNQELFEEEKNRLSEENRQLVADNETKENELKMLKEQLEKTQMKAVAVASTTSVTAEPLDTTKEQSEQSEEEADFVTVTSTVQHTKEITRLTEEINQLYEENKKASEGISKLNQEHEQLKEQLNKEKEHIMQLQEENTQLGKDKTRFEKNATEQKQEARDLRKQCTLLHEQLKGLLEVTAKHNDDNDTEEKLKAAEAERLALEEQQNKMKEEFERLKEQYKSEHNEQETDGDKRNEEMQHMWEKMKEEEEKLKKAQSTIAVMTMLKEGSVPDTIDTSSLGTSAGHIEELEDQISKLEEERDSLEVQIEKISREKEHQVERLNIENDTLSDKNNNLENKLTELESEIEELKAELNETKDSVPDQPTLAVEGEDISLMSTRLAELQEEVDKTSRELDQQKSENSINVDEIESLRQELANMKEGSASGEDALRAELKSTKDQLEAEIASKSKDLAEAKKRIEELEKKLLANVPVDTMKEIESYQQRLTSLQQEKENLSKDNLSQKASVTTLTAKIETLTNNIERQRKTEKELQDSNKRMRFEKDKEVKEAKEKAESRSKQKAEESNKMIQMLQKRIKELEASGIPRGEAKVDTSAAKRKDSKAFDPEKLAKEKEKLMAQIDALKKTAQEDHKRIKTLEKEVKDAAKNAKPAGPSAEDRAAAKKMDKQLKDAQKNLEMEKKKFDKVKENLTKTEEELKELKKEYDALVADSKKDKADLAKLGVAAQEGLAAQEKLDELTKELSGLREENKTLSDNFNSERILRKKYYNMVEDMKGKIRVYCRARPLSRTENERGNHSVIKSPDEYSIVVGTARGPKDFQFDQVFTPEHGQEKVFEDTNNLIQSAVDGYNVCIFAYGQTGSGKTFTMIGDKEGNFPGIAPRAMEAIFSLIEQNKKKFSFKVHTYMLELYNDKLIDLLAPHNKEPAKLEIKKDKKGLVFINGSVMLEADSKDTLWEIFERGSENRHVSSTKMNAESSRSHLILGIVIESTNLTSGAVVKGKLSLVDLAGSERAAKTEASPEQLKEAQSINKSLSALGDVISALSSDQQFIPYRNNKLTMVMQDSLGGNAKTLMFVNISPADYNTDETVTSLTYASRVKLITNDAQKNSDNKEISRLKGIIAKLKKGEVVDEDID